MSTQAVARVTDPQTSHDAAAGVLNIRQSQQLVLNILKINGPLTDEELLANVPSLVKISPSGVRTRRSELVARGLVEDSGTKKKLASGRNAIVWRAVNSVN